MNYKIVEEQQTATIYVEGELDMSVGEKLGSTVRNVANKYNQIVLDFRGVSFVDSSGIGSLFFTTKELLEEGKELRIQNVHQDIYDILKILGFAEALGVQIEIIS